MAQGKKDSEKMTRKTLYIKKDQDKYIEDHDINASKILRDAIERRREADKE